MDIRIARNDYEQRLQGFKRALYKAMSSFEYELSLHNQLLMMEKRFPEEVELVRVRATE